MMSRPHHDVNQSEQNSFLYQPTLNKCNALVLQAVIVKMSFEQDNVNEEQN